MKTTHESRLKMRSHITKIRKNNPDASFITDMVDVLLDDIEEILSGAISVDPINDDPQPT